MAEKKYLRITPAKFGESDSIYEELGNDKTWGEVLQSVEAVLDNHYLDNNDSMLGIKIEILITNKLPKGFKNFEELREFES
ncbi:MAG: hypothetical protein GY861_18050 [bacterium]|nr:hypothetical protein [bacterium]